MVLKSRYVSRQKDYTSEFGDLGLEKVRSELLMRRWEADKLAAARLWVEKQDTKHWLAGRGDAAPVDKKKWLRKYGLYIALAFGLAYGLTRIYRSIRWGG
jgi:hypothetical protein